MRIVRITQDEGIVHAECGHCRGAGSVAVELLTKALHACTWRWQSTAEIAERIGVSSTHCANLMADLRRFHAVERRGSGARHSPYEWRLAKSRGIG